MMKKWLAMVVVMSGYLAVAQEGNEQQNIEEQLNQLRQTVKQQQNQLEELSKKVSSASETTNGLSFKLNDAYGSFKLSGDVRFRYENQSFEDADGRDRLRTRLRLGGVWTSKDKSWEIGLGLASGKSSTSTNVTWAESGKRENFGSMSMDIDYIYARHYFDSDWGMQTLTIGQVKNPFINAGILWDGDMTPVGVTYGWSQQNYFVTVGAYELIDLGKNAIDDKTWLFATQAGMKLQGEKLSGRFALGAYFLNDRNDAKTGAIEITDDNFKFQILQAYGEIETKVKNVKLTAFTDLWYNVGADGEVSGNGFGTQDSVDGKNALGWVIGLKVGYGKASLGAEYIYSGAYSSYWKLTDSDFGNGVNYQGSGTCHDVQGVRLKAGYKFNKNISLNATYLYYQRINDTNVTNSYGQTCQIDLSYKF